VREVNHISNNLIILHRDLSDLVLLYGLPDVTGLDALESITMTRIDLGPACYDGGCGFVSTLCRLSSVSCYELFFFLVFLL